jgi:isopenicillin-N epimerase
MMQPDGERVGIREHWLLDPEVTFLNHGSFGSCPREVLEVQSELRARMEHAPIRFLARDLADAFDEVKGALGEFIGADPQDLVLLSNATTAVNAVLRSLEFAPGDEILFTDHGYNACNNAVRFVAERAGAKAVVAKIPFPIHSPDEVVEAVLAATGPRTRLALIDHITSPTGLVFPIERLVGELRERGVQVLVDGAHAPGMVEFDLDALDADYYTGNCHKWLCAPKGAAFLHVRRELQPRIRPAVISHGANSPDPTRSRFHLEFDWTGTGDPTPLLCIPTAIDFVGSLLPGGWPAVRAHNRALALRAQEILCVALGIEPPAPEEMIASLVTVPLPDGDVPEPHDAFWVPPFQRELIDQHRIEAPVWLWPEPPACLLRVSAALYNHEAQYESLAAILSERFGS